MSHHFSKVGDLFHNGRVQRGVRVKDVPLYLASVPIPHLQRTLFRMVADTCLSKRPFCPSQVKLGSMTRRSRETVCRALKALAEQDLIRKVRRGRRLTNVYLLARRIWQRITGQEPPYQRERQLQLGYRNGIARGLSPPRAVLEALREADDG